MKPLIKPWTDEARASMNKTRKQSPAHIFSVHAYADDCPVVASFETARDAFAKAVEWRVVASLSDVLISDGTRRFTIEEFSELIARL